jgi:hypothetical protein
MFLYAKSMKIIRLAKNSVILPNRLRSNDELLACVRYGRGGGGGGGSFLGPICVATAAIGRLVGPDWPLGK